MAHYAIINPATMQVTQVFVGRDEDDLPEGIDDWETYYAPAGTICCRTSYNTHGNIHSGGGEPFRKNYAGIGYTWDEARDAFIPPQPFPSWILDETTCLWSPPIPMPEGGRWEWDEGTGSWVAL